MATEKEYDEVIAPMLLAVARRCEELGMSLVARVEWEPECSGITQINVANAGIGQKLTQIAAHADGNFDALSVLAIKHFDCSKSAVLARLQ